MSFNKAQITAIESRKGNFLVSAGAGSGKTMVLTERIKRIVVSGDATLDELLVLTFTNKAAQEMKSRTRSALLKAFKDGEINKDLSGDVECSDITTFDAFFLQTVKKYAFHLGIDADVIIADDSFLKAERRTIIESLLNERYQTMDPTFAQMVKLYTLKDDSNIVDLILGILDLCELVPDQEQFFLDFKEKYFLDDYFEEQKQRFYERCNSDLRASFYLLKGSVEDLLAQDGEYVSSFINLGSYDNLYGRFAAEWIAKEKKADSAFFAGREFPLGFKTKPRDCELSEDDEFRREMARSLFKEVADSIKRCGDPTRQKEKYLATKEHVSLLADIASDAYCKMREYKKERNAYSFADIASLARELLNDENIREEIKNKYRFIMIDEYQDTSDLQESFIEKIENDNLFMVGDIKQSIYRFRNANPSIFSGKLADYEKGIKGQPIYLQENFRSRLEVINGINALFERIMSRTIGDVDYEKGQALFFGNKSLYGVVPKDEYTTRILRYPQQKTLERGEIEARVIANDILSKVNSRFEIDAKKEGRRPCKWSDFAILIPAKSEFSLYEKVFGEAKIPLVATLDADLSDDDINMVFMRLLRLPLVLGVNETATKHCYASLKRSYLYQEDDNQLFDEIQSGRYVDDPLIRGMREDRNKLLGMSIYEAVSYLVEKYRMVERLLVLGNVKNNFKKIAHFLDNALTSDKMGLDFQGYVDHFESLMKYDIKNTIGGDTSDGNTVKLMSVHASKGLEFPIVYCPSNARKMNRADTNGFYLVTKEHGILLPWNRTDEWSGNFLYLLYKTEEEEKGISEYMRLFYVSLTRACNEIIFVMPEGSGASYRSFEVKETNSVYLGRLVTKLDEKGKEKKEYKLVIPLSFAEFLYLAGEDFVCNRLREENGSIAIPMPFMEEGRIKHMAAPHLGKVDCPPLKMEEKRASKTSFIAGNEAALVYGERLHRLLEVTSFIKKDASFIAEQSERTKIERVLSNDLFKNLEGYREYHEYKYIDEKNDLHGSIDLLLIKPCEKAIIVDYKTKHLDDEAYGTQLRYYRDYVQRSFGIPVETYLLSISDGDMKVVE